MLARISFGYVLGTVAAALVVGLNLALMKALGQGLRDNASDIASMLLFVAIYATLFIGAAALLPSVPLIVYAERNRLRSLRFYLAASVGAGIVGFELLAVGFGEFPIFSSLKALEAHAVQLLIFVVLPGLAAGWVYWGIAGREAGDTSRPFW
jgi:type III secretory pathway component EscS